MDLSKFDTNNDLAVHFNRRAKELGDEARVKVPWKSSRGKLEEMLAELEARHPAPKPEPEKPAKKPSGKTIRQTALDLLCHVEYHEDRNKDIGPANRVPEGTKGARSVGLPYLEIIRRIKEEHPGANTSVACLRWYAVKMRAEEFGFEGYKLAQRRPRFEEK